MKAGELVALTLAREVANDPPETNDRARLLRVSLYAALDAVDALTAELARLRDDRDELRATLDNERGEGVQPSEGWVFDPDDKPVVWYRPNAPGGIATRYAKEWGWCAGNGDDHGFAPTARAAMIAADLATKEKS